jgi:outer membrane receptor protein involved in Fe transport
MDGALRLNMNVFNSQNDGFLLAAVVNTGTQNRNADAEITGFEGNMMMFLSENTMLEASWLFLDHEIVSDTKLINYLNPAGAPVAQYVGIVDPLGAGVTTAAAHTNGVVLFKSGGYNCTEGFLFTNGCTGDEGIPVNLKGNSLPGSADESYSVALTQLFNMTNGVASARLSYRYTGESNTDVFNMERFDLEARDTIDFLVRYEPNNADWYVGLFVKNIEDEQQVQSLRAASNVQGGQLFGSFTDPRIYGLQFGSKF